MKLVSQYQMVGRLPSNPTDNSLPTVNIYILYIQISLSEVKLHAEFTNVGISIFKKSVHFVVFKMVLISIPITKTSSFKFNIHVRLILICRFNLLSTMVNWRVNYILPLANITKPLLEYFYHQNLLKFPLLVWFALVYCDNKTLELDKYVPTCAKQYVE